ncbi:MAG: HD domain-containing protein [Desulfobacteraceae bacterium]|nr:MAG: HD domain-containing protein [Desulfobacteraceae bacterium]
MVEFRDLFSRGNLQKKKETRPEAPEPGKGKDRLNFRDIASEVKKNAREGEEGGAKPSEIVPSKLPNKKEVFRFGDVYPQTEESPSRSAVIHPVIKPSIPHLPPELEKKRQLLYHEVAKYLREVFEAVKKRRRFSISAGFKIMHQMVESQPPYDPLFINAIHQDNPGEYIIYHSVNVSIFAVKIAQYLGYSNKRQEEIGMAGLLHDVGAALVSDDILYKRDALDPREISILRERPLNTFKLLNQFGEQYQYLADCAYQVYERFDGSGYPNGMMGDEIKEYAQIIGLLDMYEALIHSRPQRIKFLHFNAVKEIIKTHKKGFKKEHLKALLNSFSIFPLSSYVRLNSDAIGKVIETYPDQPLRPKIRIEFDSQDRRVLTERIVDLSQNTLLHIIDSVSEADLKSQAADKDQ